MMRYREVSLRGAEFVLLYFVLLLRTPRNKNGGGRCGRPCENCCCTRECWERLRNETCFGGCGIEDTSQRMRNKDEENGWHIEHRRGKEGAGIKKTNRKNKENEQIKEETKKTNKIIKEERTRKKDKNGELRTEETTTKNNGKKAAI